MSSKADVEKLPSNLKRMLKQANVQAPHIQEKLEERASKQMETYLQIILLRMHERQLILQQRENLEHSLNVLHVMTTQTENSTTTEE